MLSLFRAMCAFVFLVPGTVVAHDTTQLLGEPGIRAAAAFTWRSEAVVEPDAFWRIPGVQMGGEAWPAEAGFALDDAHLMARYAIGEYTQVSAKLSSHGGGADHNGVELDHLFISHSWATVPVVLSAGRMSGAFAPSAAWHSSLERFSEAPLLSDVFFGRYFDDDGLRVKFVSASGITLGAEAWAGRAFPATSGSDGGSADVFLNYEWHGNAWSGRSGIWAMHAKALRRADARYSGAHAHSTPLNALPADIRFTGTSQLGGAWLQTRFEFNDVWAVMLDAEWAASRVDGDILDATRRAGLDADYSAWFVTPAVEIGRHTFAVRYEGMAYENRISGPAAAVLAQHAGLMAAANTPRRISMQWRWQITPELALRAEYIRDESLPEAAMQKRDRVALGIVWQQALWP